MEDEPDKRAGTALKTDWWGNSLGCKSSVLRHFINCSYSAIVAGITQKCKRFLFLFPVKDNVKREFGVLQKTSGTSIIKGALVEEPKGSALPTIY